MESRAAKCDAVVLCCLRVGCVQPEKFSRVVFSWRLAQKTAVAWTIEDSAIAARHRSWPLPPGSHRVFKSKGEPFSRRVCVARTGTVATSSFGSGIVTARMGEIERLLERP
jgi:hypothetical protein